MSKRKDQPRDRKSIIESDDGKIMPPAATVTMVKRSVKKKPNNRKRSGPPRQGEPKCRPKRSIRAVAVLHIDAKCRSRRKKALFCFNHLTMVEREVYELMVEGKSAIAIADELGCSVFTVNNHTKNIFSVFGVNSRSEVIAMLAVPITAKFVNI